MTTVTLFRSKEGVFTGLKVEGHAEYAEAGSDIACAAVSALTINTINAVDQFTKDKVNVTQDEEQALIEATFEGENGVLSPEATLLLQSYEMGVTELAKQYDAIQAVIKERG